jgi:adenylate kinase
MKYVLITTNELKADEFRSAFEQHGHKVISLSDVPTETRLVELLRDEGFKAAFVEESGLFADAAALVTVTPQEDMQIVYNQSWLEFWSLNLEGELVRGQYNATVRGFIDLDRAKPDETVFGWDDVFVPLEMDTDFHALKQEGMKSSARQINIGRFIVDHLYYSSRLDLQFNPCVQETTVEFSPRAAEFLLSDPLLVKGTQGTFLQDMLNRVVNDGVFFRSAQNRREKNYWLPGLNAGIPLTAKKDAVHEVTFMFHDIMHFQIPDLIFDGRSPHGKSVYSLHRMMGEAITLVLADMLFVDGLKQSGMNYDWAKRKIYPLYQQLDLPHEPVARLRALLHANMSYALFGDDTEFLTLLRPGADGLAALDDYKEKYSRFFAEDWRWTTSNYDNMAQQDRFCRQWVNDIVGRKTFAANGLTLLSDFTTWLHVDDWQDHRQVAEALFDVLFLTVLQGRLTTKTDAEPRKSASNGFKRYMIGQLSIFARYGRAYDNHARRNKLRSILTRPGSLSETDITNTLALYHSYIDDLMSRKIITDDDGAVFKAMHPVFPPFYVFYDAKKETPLAACPDLYLGSTKEA